MTHKGEGTWIPLEELATLLTCSDEAIRVYLFLNTFDTITRYPGVWEMGSFLPIEPEKIWDFLEELYDKKLLNDYDIKEIHKHSNP